MLAIVFISVFSALAFTAGNYFAVKRKDPGLPIMREIADAIAQGADAFIRHEYGVIFKIGIIIAIILGIIVSWYTGVAFLIGALMSSSAGWVGMKIAVIANVRVSNTARTTKSMGSTLKVAFQGGSVMGLSVGGFALLGLGFIYLTFGKFLNQLSEQQLTIVTNWIGINFIPFTMTVSGYALGCSIIAMFDRVGGGIYTKAADMGADLVGKTEAHIPEDDPRNPATIADNVGDNVGDVAGLGADLLESYVGAIISSIVLAAYIFYTSKSLENSITASLTIKLLKYPIFFASIGILSCIIGIASLLIRKNIKKPHTALNFSTWVSEGCTIFFTLIFTLIYFKGENFGILAFRFGAISPWLSSVIGIIAGIVIGMLAEYYTSYDYNPTKNIAAASNEGASLTITSGLAVGMKSTILPVIILGFGIILADFVGGLYGVAMAAIGMLSVVSATVSVDTYGPIADNAGGISEMSKLEPEVREITDHLDSVGNTTAAIGKGFAIGSASLAALSLFASYLYTQAGPGHTTGYSLIINLMDTFSLGGAIIGAALPFLFSGILIDAVAKAAQQMVMEVRRQFKENPKILSGEEKPDYRRCIKISSAGAINQMKLPAFISVLTPLITGFLFGAKFVGGLLIGTTLSSIMLAIFTANSGGAWDNAKKYIEQGRFGGKGSSAHAAGIIGDTVGDPLKDTVGPSLDILIKIMAVVSLIMVNIFGKYNLVGLLQK